MSNEFVSALPSTFVERGFLTGRPITIAGVRAGSRPTKSGDSARVGVTFFYTETAKDGERRILSGFMHDGAWSDQMKPAENLKGLVPEAGADRPFIEKNSSLGLFNASLAAAGCPPKLQTGDYSKLVGMVVQLEDKTLPSFRRKKSVDPDEAAAPQREFKTEVVSKIITLPSDNGDFTALTQKEITTYLKEREDKSAARRAAAGSEDEAPAAVVDDEEETPAPKKGKKAKPVVEDDDDNDSFPADDADEEPAASTDDDEEDAPPAKKGASEDAEELAEALIRKVLKGEKGKKIKAGELLRKVHPLLAGKEKKITAEVLKLVQTPKFIGGLDDISVNGALVVLG